MAEARPSNSGARRADSGCGSTMATERPACASPSARVAPVIPAPATTTSNSSACAPMPRLSYAPSAKSSACRMPRRKRLLTLTRENSPQRQCEKARFPMANASAHAREVRAATPVSALVWAQLVLAVRTAWESDAAARARGGLVAAFGAALIAAFATYDAADPSWNAASATAPTNILGTFGAAWADAGLQSLGLAAWIAALLMVAAGLSRAGS